MWISHGSINRHLNASIDLFSKQSPPTHHTTVQPHPRSERAASKPASNDRIGSIGAWRGWIRPPIPLNRPANPFLLLNRSSSSCVRVSGLLPFHRTNAAPKPLFFVRHSFARLLLCLGHPPSRHISLHCLCQPPQDQRSQQCRLSCGQLGWWGVAPAARFGSGTSGLDHPSTSCRSASGDARALGRGASARCCCSSPGFRQQPRQGTVLDRLETRAATTYQPNTLCTTKATGRAAWKLRLPGSRRRSLCIARWYCIKEQTAAGESVSAPSTLSTTPNKEAMLLRRRSGVLALLLAVAAGVAVLVVEAFAPSSFPRACLALACCVVRQSVGDDRPVLGQTNDPKY